MKLFKKMDPDPSNGEMDGQVTKDGGPEVAVKVKKTKEESRKRKIKFDDFEVDGEEVYCREGVIVQVNNIIRILRGLLGNFTRKVSTGRIT